MNSVDLREYSGLFKAYTELRVQENRNVSVALVNGSVMGNSRSATGGVSARVYQNGAWGFASSPEKDSAAIKSVIERATDNAKFLDSREAKGKGPLPVVSVEAKNDFSTKKPRLSQRDLVEFLREIDKHVAEKYPRLASRRISVAGLDMEKLLLTSDGSYSHSMTPRTGVSVSLTMQSPDGPVSLGKSFGGLGQFEDVMNLPSDLYEGIAEIYEHLVKKSEGVFAEAGAQTVVMHPDLAGILAHEAIGHTTEADLVMAGSAAGPLMNKEAATPLVTLVDFAHTSLGKTCPVPVYVDDEGTEAKDVYVIKDGILRSFMHNKESAAFYGVEPTGNARAFAFSDEPLIRMRNTAIMPGESKLEDMIASVDKGYFLMRPSNGQADSTSEFMFGVVLGYEIKNGKLGKAIKDTTISGVAFDMLKTVTMVSDEMSWGGAGGMCGKKQSIPVGMGGPAIKCVVSIGGR